MRAFFYPGTRRFGTRFFELQSDGRPVDELLVADLCGKDGISLVEINAISERIETVAMLPFWIEILKRDETLRGVIDVGTRAVQEAYEWNCPDPSEFVGRVEAEIMAMSDHTLPGGSGPIREGVDRADATIALWRSGEKQAQGVMSGIRGLDKLTMGFQRGQMIVLAARPSVGKTSLAMNIVEDLALPTSGEDGRGRSLVFSMEMPMEDLAMRLICGRAGIHRAHLKDAIPLGVEKEAKLRAVIEEMRMAPIVIDDTSSLTIAELRAKARRVKMRNPDLSLVVVDYLQLMRGTDPRMMREQQIAEISRGLKGMAMELGVPVIVLSQLNRESERNERPPRMSDLRESGAIEQDADVILLLHRPVAGKDDAGVELRSAELEALKLIVAKQRNGETGVVDLVFHRQRTRFSDAGR